MPGSVAGTAEAALQFLFHADNLTAEKVDSIAKNVTRLAASLKVETKRVKNFKIDVHWKSRVINVPIAIAKFQTLVEDLTSGLEQKVKDIGKPFADFAHDAKLLAETPPDPQVSRIATGFNELETFIASLNKLVGDVDSALSSSLSLTSLFDRVLQDLQHLEDLFLSQKSKRTKTTATYFKRNA
jgi:hypothetical protein